jgi:5-methylcytosine-specific restriction endonuclease McrA
MGHNTKKIYEKTDGYCHICHKKLSLINYGKNGERGAWHVDHSIPKVKGGTDHMNNLYPACISCDTSKGANSTNSARAKNGITIAPFSRKKKKELQSQNTITGGIIGGAVGAFLGPAGVIVGTVIGATIGNNNSPKR